MVLNIQWTSVKYRQKRGGGRPNEPELSRGVSKSWSDFEIHIVLYIQNDILELAKTDEKIQND